MTILKKLVVGLTIATANPAVTDDKTKGHYIGEYWLHGTSQFICTDAATGAAVWTAVGSGGGGGSVNSVTAGDGSITIGGTATDPTVVVAVGGVDTVELAAGAVTTAKLAANAVTAAKLDVVCSTPGSFTNVDVTVTADGRITAIANGAGGGGGGGSSDPSATYKARILAYASLVSFWLLDETTGTTLVDSGPGGNDLTAAVALAPGSDAFSAPGAIAGSVQGSFGGTGATNGYAGKTSPSLPIGAAARTMECWVRSADTTSTMLMCGYGTAATDEMFALVMNDGATGLVALDYFGATQAKLPLSSLNDGQWHHYVATYDGSVTLKLYVDGHLVQALTLGGALNTVLNASGFQILGRLGTILTQPMRAWIDNVAVYSAALTDAEVLGNWNAGRIGGGGGAAANSYQATVQAAADLVAYWKCDEAFGATTLVDFCGANDLVVSAAVPGLDSLLTGSAASSMCCFTAGIAAKKTSPTGAIPVAAAARSLELIFKSTYTSACFLAAWGSSGNRNAFGIAINAGGANNLAAVVYGDDLIVSNLDVLDGRPHHVVMTYDGATALDLWLDGQHVGTHTLSSTLTTTYNADGMQIGTNIFLTSDYQGRISDVAIYDAVLSGAAILDHYKRSKGAA